MQLFDYLDNVVGEASLGPIMIIDDHGRTKREAKRALQNHPFHQFGSASNSQDVAVAPITEPQDAFSSDATPMLPMLNESLYDTVAMPFFPPFPIPFDSGNGMSHSGLMDSDSMLTSSSLQVSPSFDNPFFDNMQVSSGPSSSSNDSSLRYREPLNPSHGSMQRRERGSGRVIYIRRRAADIVRRRALSGMEVEAVNSHSTE